MKLSAFVIMYFLGLQAAFGWIVQSADEAQEFPQATLSAKVRIGPIAESDGAFRAMSGTKCDTTGQVISMLKGSAGKNLRITFRRGGNGFRMPGVDSVVPGGVYIVMLQGTAPPYVMWGAMKAVDSVIEPSFGTKPGDRLMAELAAMWKSNDPAMRIDAIEQIGVMHDARGSAEVNAAAKSPDDATARAGVMAQYRLKINPDMKRVMELFDPKVMDVWYGESGTPQKDSRGMAIRRRAGGISFIERGVTDFDCATYVREGIKKDWVRRDDQTLYKFFGTPWKIQRPACVPALVELLKDPDKKVRWWAVKCLMHTVEDQQVGPAWDQYEQQEQAELSKWNQWWTMNGKDFVAGTQRIESGQSEERHVLIEPSTSTIRRVKRATKVRDLR